jgi:hypothetical protein
MSTRKQFWELVRILDVVGALLCLIGIFLIAPSFAIFTEGMLLQETMTIFAVTLLGSPFLKIILSLILFRSGLNLLYVKRTRKWGVFVHILFGILTIPPFLFGEPSMIILILLSLGPLPFVPYFIAGSLFILAGIMGGSWKH